MRRLSVLTGFAALTLAGVASAQPATPPQAPMAPTAPPAAVAEEAPPVNVPPPAPMIVPPISAKEVTAAAPPKAQTIAKAAENVRRARYDVAILQAIDKVTAESLRFEAAIGRPIRFKGLIFTVRACERTTPDEAVDDSIAYLTIFSQPKAASGKASPTPRQVFKGWMYASSPGLNPLEHPVYDAWLITCRAAAPPPPPPPPSR